jgi:hypothetical protein
MKKFKPNLKSVDTFGARESVRPHRSYLDNEYIEKGYMALLPHSTTALYVILGKFANNKTQICYPSSSTLMELAGMKNKNTFHRDIKLLVHYRIIRVVSGSKGRVPNVYQLLSHTLWKEINSNDFDTVKNSLKSKTTVSKEKPQQYQKVGLNSDRGDTGNQINKSDEKIRLNLQLKGKDALQRLNPAAASMLKRYFAEEQLITALEELCLTSDKNFGTKEVMAFMTSNKIEPLEPTPTWLK